MPECGFSLNRQGTALLLRFEFKGAPSEFEESSDSTLGDLNTAIETLNLALEKLRAL